MTFSNVPRYVLMIRLTRTIQFATEAATTTGIAKLRVLPKFGECSRQVEADVVSNGSYKIHQTWQALFWRTL